eukprot:m.28594 g.28594  ORF g.28594 m.28594 type:complete len:68 (+) comp30876_c0_seq1:228-431(+)
MCYLCLMAQFTISSRICNDHILSQTHWPVGEELTFHWEKTAKTCLILGSPKHSDVTIWLRGRSCHHR